MSETKTHWKKLTNPDYIGAYSLQPKEEKILTIAKISREKVVGSGGKKQECTVAHFVETGIKPMILNRLNCKIITKIYGTAFIEDWGGKKIQIFAEMVDAFGEQVEALRIRPFAPGAEKSELLNNTPALDKAIDFIKGGGSVADIQKKYKLSDEVKLILENHVR